MNIKLNRGPGNRKRMVVEDWQTSIRIAVPRTRERLTASLNPPLEVPTFSVRDGEYVKSHTRLKDGTVIFEWIGYIN